MKNFLSRLLIFLAPIVIGLYPLDLALSYFYKQTHRYPGEIEVWNDIYNGQAKCEVAVYGSSRAWVQIDSQILMDSLGASVYNFGMDGHNFWMQYMRHLEFVKHNPWPMHVVLSVDVFSLEKRRGLYQMNQFLPYLLWNTQMKNFVDDCEGFKQCDYLVPLVRYAGKNQVFKHSLENMTSDTIAAPYRHRGYKGMQRTWSDEFAEASEKNKGIVLEINQEAKDLMRRFIEECAAHQTQLHLVYCPEHTLGQSFVSNRSEIFGIFQSFANQYNLPFTDYSTMSICADTSYFYNASHLNIKGSQLFSMQLASDLKSRMH
jgi:hypothetical protein